MSRYIDADALKKRVSELIVPDWTRTLIRSWLDSEPTVDAVPVVRCRDCKWAEVDAWWTYCKLGHKEDTTNSIIYTCTHNFYCVDGERRTDEQQT